MKNKGDMMKKTLVLLFVLSALSGKAFAKNFIYQMSTDTMTVQVGIVLPDGTVLVSSAPSAGALTGTIADSSLSSNVALYNSSGTWTGLQAIYSGTLSALQALTTPAHALAFCLGCVNPVCVTTGTVHSLVTVTSSTTACN